MRKISEEEARKGGFIKDLDTGKIYFVGFMGPDEDEMSTYIIAENTETNGLRILLKLYARGEYLGFSNFYKLKSKTPNPVQLEHAEWFPADEYDIELVKRSEV